MEVIPSFLDNGVDRPPYDGNAFGNVRLRPGEVQEVIYPSDPRSLSRRVVEYRVLVQHVDNGTAVSKMYDYCVVSNPFGGGADFLRYTLRSEPSASRTGGQRATGPGLGAKVVLLCVSGDQRCGLIIGGQVDARGEAETDLGHQLHFRFNGLDFVVNRDGELAVTNLGPQDAKGALAEGADEDAAGSFVRLDKTGGVVVSDKAGDNSVVLDRAAGAVTVKAAQQMVLDSPAVKLGSGSASQRGVRGDDWKSLMGDVLDAIAQITVGTEFGPSSVPINSAQFQALKARLDEPLSSVVTLD